MPPPPPVDSNKPTDVSGPFQDRHIMETAKFDTFFGHANSGTLTEDEVNALENWRK